LVRLNLTFAENSCHSVQEIIRFDGRGSSEI